MSDHLDAPARPRDGGFSLVEVIVAIVLFGVMSSAVLVVVASMTRTSSDSSERIVASNLASREMEILRDAFSSPSRGPSTLEIGLVTNPSPLPGGTAGQPLVVDGVPFTVERDTTWRKVDSTAASSCDEGSNLEIAYLEVEVRVKWPGLGKRPPVSMHTLMTPQKGTFDDQTVGYLGLRVYDRLGNPQSGVRVTATKTGSVAKATTTGNDGCALFTGVAPGTWSLTVRKDNYVTEQGLTVGTVSATVAAGQFWRGSIGYDLAATMEVTVCPPTGGYTLPEQLSGSTVAEQMAVSVGNSGLTPSGSKAIFDPGTREPRDCSSGSSGSGSSGSGSGSGSTADVEVRSLGKLWPYSAGYQVWPGGCTGNDPGYLASQSGYTGTGRDLPIPSNPGETTKTTVTLLPVRADAPAGTQIEAVFVPVSAPDNGCTGGQTFRLGTVSTGPVLSSLPPGKWKIQRVGGGGTPVTVWINKGATNPVTVNP